MSGVIGRLTPTIAAICPAHMPPALITHSVSMAPCSVWTPTTAPLGERMIPATRTSVWMVTPIWRARRASSMVAPLGSSQPSPGRYMAP